MDQSWLRFYHGDLRRRMGLWLLGRGCLMELLGGWGWGLWLWWWAWFGLAVCSLLCQGDL